MRRTATLLLVLVAFGATSAAVLADTTPPATTTAPTDTTTTTPSQVVPDGVMINGIDVGGLPSDQAVSAVEAAFARPITLRFSATKVTVSPAVLGLRVAADSAVSVALTSAPGSSLTLRAGYDKALVQSFVAKLAKRWARTPESSRLLFRHFIPVVTKPVLGRKLDVGKATADLTQELVHATRGTISLRATYTRPAVTPTSIGPIVVIKRGSNQLTLYDGPKKVRSFKVATGQNIYPTPLGRFQIIVKWKNPWWYPPTQDSWAKGLKPVPPGPNNPLGTRWMGLDSPGVGIHGTDEPASIGYSLSHGCIRMLVPQAEWLFDHVNVGTPVYIVAA
ncbi:MAG: L,D-transpeptidase family protein [Actinomycetota bacterium]